MNKWIVAIDQSTSGTKALLINKAGIIEGKYAVEHTQYYPQPGWVEHDAMEIYTNVLHCIQQLLINCNVTVEQIAVLSITNQRETAVVWDKETGLPIHPAIVWQCQRTAAYCEQLKTKGYDAVVERKTGLKLDPYFSATKWSWILQQYDEGKLRVRVEQNERSKGFERSSEYDQGKLDEQGKQDNHTGHKENEQLNGERYSQLLVGTIDSWLMWKLSGGKVHATDYSNASRTLLFNIHKLEWDAELCELFGIPLQLLPVVKSSDEIAAVTSSDGPLQYEIPIAGVIGDSQGALFGNLCFEQGSAKATYGTGTSVLMNVGAELPLTNDSTVATIAWGQKGKVTYALEAVIRSSGDSIKWLREQIGLFQTYDELEALYNSVSSNEGVYLVPAFVGLGAPYWDMNARAAFVGMSRSTTKSHLARAALESIAYQVKDAAELLQQCSGLQLTKLQADGGAASNKQLMQFQADILDREVNCAHQAELSAIGSAYLAGLAVQFWSSLEELQSLPQQHYQYEPQRSGEWISEQYSGWKRAVESVLTK